MSAIINLPRTTAPTQDWTKYVEMDCSTVYDGHEQMRSHFVSVAEMSICEIFAKIADRTSMLG